MPLKCWKFTSTKSKNRIAQVPVATGSLMATHHVQPNQADNNRIFELRIYHALPGKLPALESRFCNTTSKLLAKHNLKIVGYWVPEGTPDWDNTLIFLMAHSSREEAKKNWDAMRSDPEFQAVMKSEQVDKLVEKLDVTYMRPADFSQMK